MIEQGVTNSFLYELPLAVHDFSVDTFKIALYISTADIGRNTPTYIVTGEVTSGAGYTTGGNTLANPTVKVDTTRNVVYISFDNTSWANAFFTARGALIYNSSKSNKSVAVLDFGDDKNANGLTFRVTVPADTSTTALIRLVRGQ
jgi:hypothetical protein